jgi:hypothetical protein
MRERMRQTAGISSLFTVQFISVYTIRIQELGQRLRCLRR